MNELSLLEIIGIVAGILVAVFTIVQGIIFFYDLFKAKPDIEEDFCYLNEYEKKIIYFRFQISNLTSKSFLIKQVFLKKHFILSLYYNKTEVYFKEDAETHTHKNPFSIEDIIKPNMKVTIVVNTCNTVLRETRYSSLDYTEGKIKFIFKTTTGKFKYILKKNWQKEDLYLQKIKNLSMEELNEVMNEIENDKKRRLNNY